MPTRRSFLGLTSGTAVTLSLLQSGTSVLAQTGENGWGKASAQPPSVDPALTVSISVDHPTDNRAPAGYTFNAVIEETVPYTPAAGAVAPNTDLNFLLAEIYWDDDAGGTFDEPDLVGHASFRDKSVGAGKYRSRVFDTPGTHTVNVFVYFPDGRWGTATTTVTVRAHDADYTPAQTIVLSQNGDFTGAPAHDPANQCTTLGEVMFAINNSRETEVRVLYDETQGMTFTSKQNNTLSNLGLTSIRFGTWTYGVKGIWALADEHGGTVFRAETGEVSPYISIKWVDTHIQGHYDNVLEIGNYPSGLFYLGQDIELTMHNSSDDGTYILLYGESNDADLKAVYISDYKRTNMGEFLALLPRGSGVFACLGVSHFSGLYPASGGHPKFSLENGGSGNAHNGVRIGFGQVYMQACEFSAKSGWGTYNPSSNASWRFGRNNPIEHAAITFRNVIEGHAEMQMNQNEGDAYQRKILHEANIFIPNEIYARSFQSQTSGLSFRNNVMLKMGVPQDLQSSAFRSFVGIGLFRARPEGINDPAFIYGNTMVDMQSNADTDKTSSVYHGTDLNHLEIENNVLHKPNWANGPFVENLDDTSIGWDSRFKGFILNYVYNRIQMGPTAFGETTVIPYADIPQYDGTVLGQADFSGVGFRPERHRLRLEAVKLYAGPSVTYEEEATPPTQFSCSFDTAANTVTVTNLTNGNWLPGANIRLTNEKNANGTLSYTVATMVPPNASFTVANTDNMPEPSAPILKYSSFLTGGEHFTLAAGPAGIEFTNVMASQDTISFDMPFGLVINTGDNQTRVMDTWEHPAGTVSLYQPTQTIPADTAAMVPLHDFFGRPRPGNHPSGPAGVPSIGATEPAI